MDILRPVTLEYAIETGGEIYSVEIDGQVKYKYTVPVVGKTNSIPEEIVDVPLSTIPENAAHKADYHVHPGGGFSRHSGSDIRRARKLKVGSYVRSSSIVYYDGKTNTACGVDFTHIGEIRYGLPKCN